MKPRISRQSAEVFARQLPEEDRAEYLDAVTADEARSRGSKAANEADHAFMEWCRGQHRAAKLAGIVARVRHCGPPVRFIGRGMCEPIGVGPADFQGQLSKRYGAVAVAIEAKSREGRLSLAEIPQHQRDDLDECADGGGLALLLYEHRDEHRVRRFAVPWREVPWVERSRTVHGKAQHSKSVGPEDLRAWEVGVQPYLLRFVTRVP